MGEHTSDRRGYRLEKYIYRHRGINRKDILVTNYLPSVVPVAFDTYHYDHRELRCFEEKIEEREKAGSCQELNPWHLTLCNQCSATKPRQPDDHQLSQSFVAIHCTDGTEVPQSHTLQPLSMTQKPHLGLTPKNHSIGRELMLSDFCSLNTYTICFTWVWFPATADSFAFILFRESLKRLDGKNLSA